MGLVRRALPLVVVAVLAWSAARPCLAADAPLVFVAPARNTPDARRAAHELAAALGAIARVEETDVAPDPVGAVVRGHARAIVVLDAAPDAFSLTAFGADGRSWAPRPIARRGAEALVSENVASAGISIVTAVLAASPPKEDGENDASPAKGDPAPTTTSMAPSAAPPAPSAAPSTAPPLAPPPPREAPPAAPSVPAEARARVDAAFVATNVGPELPLHSGAAVGAWWLATPVRFGAAYAFYPGAVVDGSGASLLLTRHTIAIGARVDARFGRWQIAGSAGPLAEVWVRSTRSVAATAAAAPSATLVTAGAFGRAGLTWWALSSLGIEAGLGVELAPASPHFRGPAGADVLSPNVARARADLGLAAEFR